MIKFNFVVAFLKYQINVESGCCHHNHASDQLNQQKWAVDVDCV